MKVLKMIVWQKFKNLVIFERKTWNLIIDDIIPNFFLLYSVYKVVTLSAFAYWAQRAPSPSRPSLSWPLTCHTNSRSSQENNNGNVRFIWVVLQSRRERCQREGMTPCRPWVSGRAVVRRDTVVKPAAGHGLLILTTAIKKKNY